MPAKLILSSALAATFLSGTGALPTLAQTSQSVPANQPKQIHGNAATGTPAPSQAAYLQGKAGKLTGTEREYLMRNKGVLTPSGQRNASYPSSDDIKKNGCNFPLPDGWTVVSGGYNTSGGFVAASSGYMTRRGWVPYARNQRTKPNRPETHARP